MKRATLNHPKLHALMKHAKITRRDALGLLTLLWDFTGQYAPDGGIGKYTNPAIAAACDWVESPDELISCLVKSGWVDEVTNQTIRLVVHDWPDHCEQWVSRKLERTNTAFCVPKTTRDKPFQLDGVASHNVQSEKLDKRSALNPPQSQPNPNPSHPQPSGAADALRRVGAKTKETYGASTDQILAHYLSIDGTVKSRAAVVVSRLKRSEVADRDAITAKAVCDAVSNGIVHGINGRLLNGAKVKWNSDGVSIDGELLLPTKSIGEAVYS